ncbi:DUF424 family protein [Candidatus Woesearchaeota archaeon]|nr:DUF424 family protein [Candidatus Woesearchaeota archaeon]
MPGKNNKILVKIHKSQDRDIAAVCDEDLINKKFEDKNFRLDVSEEFYKGKKMNEDEALDVMKKAEILNIVGKKSINLALKNGIIIKEHIIKIKGIPHAQLF